MNEDYKDNLQEKLCIWLEANCKGGASEALTVLANVFAGMAIENVANEKALIGLFEYIFNGAMQEFQKQRKAANDTFSTIQDNHRS